MIYLGKKRKKWKNWEKGEKLQEKKVWLPYGKVLVDRLISINVHGKWICGKINGKCFEQSEKDYGWEMCIVDLQ